MPAHFSTENNVTRYKAKPYGYKKKEKKFDKNTLSNCLFKHKLKSYIKMNKLQYHPIQFISSVRVFAIYSKTWL